MTKVWLFLFALIMFACGAPIDGEDELELGTVEQGITGKVTPTYQFGTQTGSARQKCNRTSSGQVCTVPTTVNLKVCSGNVRFATNLGSFAAGRAAAMRAELHAISGFAFNWPAATNNVLDGMCQFCFEDGTCDSANGLDANIVIVKGAVGASGTASNDVKDYAAVTFFKGNGSDGLSEGAGVIGSYKSHQMCRIDIDEVDLLAKGTNSTQDALLIDHAVANSLLACAGFGRLPMSAGGNIGNYARSFLNPNVDTTQVSSGEVCQANGYTLSTLTDYNNNATACASD